MLGVFTFVIPIALIYLIFFMLDMDFIIDKRQGLEIRNSIISIIHIATIAIGLFFAFHVIFISKLKIKLRILWLSLLLFLNIFIMPYYWYRYIWLKE